MNTFVFLLSTINQLMFVEIFVVKIKDAEIKFWPWLSAGALICCI